MSASADDWADAYLRQAKKEWQVWLMLRATTDIPECVRLHLLQMSMEKLGKAYRLRRRATTVEDARSSHLSFAKTVSAVLNVRGREIYPDLDDYTLRFLKRFLVDLARDIERLCPSVDKDNTKSNSEYPWEHGGSVVVPAEYTFTIFDRLNPWNVNGLRMMKLIDTIFVEAAA